MAGVKGRSGGARPGAGRPRNPALLVTSKALQEITDPLAWLRAAMGESEVPMSARIEIAAALLQMQRAVALYEAAMRGSASAAKQFLRGSRSKPF